MCLLSYLPPRTQPDMQALYNGTFWNRDGHGYAIVAGERILVHRGMGAEVVLEGFERDRAEHPDGPALFHSRLATDGDVHLANCHPFPVGQDPRTVIAHNGMLPNDVVPARDDIRSDTRICAENFIPRRLGSLHTARSRRRLSTWMGRLNKIVILTVDPRYAARAYILNEEAGIWHRGTWYSNDTFEPSPLLEVAWHDLDTTSAQNRLGSNGFGGEHDGLDGRYAIAGDRVRECGVCLSAVPADERGCSACGDCLICSGHHRPGPCTALTP
ncbi:hypothetical protein LWF15_30675 [Kineosporia rhizophila]|uniref:hypothetical protein n=1 Tax=Kineosporia rhizophila TaxID=84633 RepID=UPI001E352551|nr:hypothetical protein [Kineosporia rhizophila]MCE0539869.1 hypothetical protein [Kineosporia rhizophila]